MGCHAPAEDVEDDDRRFLVAAQEDVTLVAHLLLRLSRSEAPSSAWSQLRDVASPSAGAEDELPLPEPPKWGQRRPRSRGPAVDGSLAVKREESRRSSPTTPLSWSGGSGGGSWTSGSASESAPPTRPPKRRKQPDSVSRHDVMGPSAASAPARRPKPEPHEDCCGHSPAPPCKWKKMEVVACTVARPPPRSAPVAPAPSAVGSPGSAKAEAAGGSPPRTVAHADPFRLKSTGEGRGLAVVRRPGKKKTIPELKALNESLWQEQVELRKELKEHKKIFEVLLKENIRLKNLATSWTAFRELGGTKPAAKHSAAAKDGESTLADPLHLRRVSPNPPPCQPPLFDLNCPPDDGLLL